MFDENIVRVIKLANKYPIISRVGIFGSYASGKQTASSDIDVLFDYEFIDENSVLDILDYGDELSKEFEKLNLDFDYVSYKGVIDSKDNETKNNIINGVVWVYDKLSKN